MGSSATLGTEAHPLTVAIVGSGPAGFYAAQALFRSEHTVRVDMLDRLPTPFGLVRGGVAPDHPKIKEASLVFEGIADDPRFAFFGNVMVGRGVSVDELKATHHVVIFACGAEVDRRLGIPGEDLPGSHTATEFVGWYNGHPDYRDRQFDLAHESAVIIGQGNVAADVARILATPVSVLATTDIAAHALEALAASAIREIHVVGRRGPAQAKFTTAELRELGEVEDCDAVVAAADLELNAASRTELADKRGRVAAKNFALFQEFAGRPRKSERAIVFHFLESPVRLEGDDRLMGVVLARNTLEGEPFAQAAEAGESTRVQPCGILFRSIGYCGVAVPGLPYDARRGVIPNREGRVADGETVLPGLYVAGWIKRGPTGIIGTNKADAVATVGSLLADLAGLPATERPGTEALAALLTGRGVRRVGYDHWRKIDAAEVERGRPHGKPREKFTSIADMLRSLD